MLMDDSSKSKGDVHKDDIGTTSPTGEGGKGEIGFGRKKDMERVEEVKLVPLLRWKRVIGE